MLPFPHSALCKYDPACSLQDSLLDQCQLPGWIPLSGLHPLRQHRGSWHSHPHHGGVLLRSQPAVEPGRGKEGAEGRKEQDKKGWRGRRVRVRGCVAKDRKERSWAQWRWLSLSLSISSRSLLTASALLRCKIPYVITLLKPKATPVSPHLKI